MVSRVIAWSLVDAFSAVRRHWGWQFFLSRSKTMSSGSSDDTLAGAP